ncbi:hypothetical protein [Moraxella nonliquefaciens]|uniref:Uncharacterized protein n=1 Tax=Moraxella nonliquefaciens TaxID=478 RepID=A0A1B8QT70_MORNO|nr:hypothetical protein [Moraxella nonliquefaciens]OBX88391.1 hypothetical protein A7456_00580 [Moraxella nonliquefaciens]QPT44549.1 hypothetical protein I6G26_11055 [Moraxella nonliquefaciens]QQC29569.1 hypothetical protein I6H63_09835 [Moraxella nonliquefaciens]
MKPLEVLEALRLGKEVEYKYLDDTWVEYKQTSPVGILTSTEYSFRIKPVEMITVGDISFPKPITELPVGATKIHVVDFYYADPQCKVYNEPVTMDILIKHGVAHLTRENAIAHAKALIKLSGGTYDSSS